MVLDARCLYLVELAKGEDIVANDIFFAVVLVEAACLNVVDQIIFHHDSGAALVGIESPAAVGVGIDIVKDVVSDDGALRRPKRINPAHVTEHTPADMVHVIEADVISFSQTFAIAPRDFKRRIASRAPVSDASGPSVRWLLG